MGQLGQDSTIQLAENLAIPAIGLGTWPMEGADAQDAVERAIGHGYRHIDTATNYNNEDAVGRAIAQSSVDRDDLWVTSKLNRSGHGRDEVKQAYADSLQRMGLDYLDSYLVHWPNPDDGKFVAACEGLQELVDGGKLRSWGVSNFKPAHLDAVYAAGLTPVMNQVQIDPHHLQPEQLAHNDRYELVTAAYSPLGRAGEFLEDPAVTSLAEHYGKTPAQIVLRWHLDSGRIAVPKSASDTRQQQNLDVFDFALSAQDLETIDALDTGAGPRLDADEFGH